MVSKWSLTVANDGHFHTTVTVSDKTCHCCSVTTNPFWRAIPLSVRYQPKRTRYNCVDHVFQITRKQETGKLHENQVSNNCMKPDPEFIKPFSCSTQLSMNFFLLINVKMPTIVGILTFKSRKTAF